LDFDEIKQQIPELITPEIAPAKYFDIIQRGQSVYLLGHFAHQIVSAYQDDSEHWLLNPKHRTSEIESATHYVDQETGEAFTPGVGTPAYSWRKLGLIDDHGRPTNRGVICGFFQHGEGLAVAAALEDPTYHIEEMIYHFANLRAGYRFEVSDQFSGESERLATACRQAYGPVDFEGYLQLGLPTGYGEGAAEVVRLWLEGKSHTLFSKGTTLEFGPGDIERAYIEWLSFLRHVRGAPDALIPRWKQLKDQAVELLKKHDRTSPLQNIPAIPTTELQKPPQNRIAYSKLL